MTVAPVEIVSKEKGRLRETNQKRKQRKKKQVLRLKEIAATVMAVQQDVPNKKTEGGMWQPLNARPQGVPMLGLKSKGGR